MLSFFADALPAETQIKLQTASKTAHALDLLVKIVTPLVIVIALGLLVWALMGRLYGKTVDGEREKMAKGKFIGILVTAIVLIALASIFATVLLTTILGENGTLFKVSSDGLDGLTYDKFLAGNFDGVTVKAA